MRVISSSILLLLGLLITSMTVSAEPIHLETTEFIHFNKPVVDTHVDTMMEVIDESTWLPQTNIGAETNFHFDLRKAEIGGVNAPFFAAYTSGFYGNTARSLSRTLAMLHGIHWNVEQDPNKIEFATSTDTIQRITAGNKLAALSSIEGAYALDENNAVELTQQFYDVGVRMIGFTWNYSNALGEGASRVFGNPEQTSSEGGLTTLGADVVKKMNELGMIIDVSHMAEDTFWDVLQVTEAPIIASHSGVNALKEHNRNLTDEQLLALKNNGGVISIVFYPAFLTENTSGYVRDIVDHIDYVVELIGIEHVGIGSDYDGASLPEDLQDVSEFPRIIEELTFRGYTKQEIEQIIGGNALRLMDDVAVQAESQDTFRDNAPVIIPSIKMGAAISSRTPLLSARVEEEVNYDKNTFKIIVDGISYEPEFDEETSMLSLQMKEPLEEKFHIVTFEVSNEQGVVNRETRIFYIDN